MGRDNQPRHRQAARALGRQKATRQPVERLLIVCEGKKTEPNYIEEIRQDLRLPTANVQVLHSDWGTSPIQIVDYAEHLLLNGDARLGLRPREFDRVCCVFDRDDHATYHAALAKAAALDGRHRNDEKRPVPFEAIASVPCFELWLLLHFEDVNAPLHRDDALRRLQAHLPGYAKGQGGHWAASKALLDTATRRAQARAAVTTAHDGQAPYTGMHTLVHRLVHLKTERVDD
ncbi:RloB family protein [Derxia lacustris]|uniref:RloB family protein n=1 Tax=Derxia lacustris TaxID=764842 RepID=UPI000A16E9AD|nr:RloB family protein [Derxia lacustris]